MTWKTFTASCVGDSHVGSGEPCQDAYAVDSVGDWQVLVVCDGAGSAKRSDQGARLLSDTVIAELSGWLPEVAGQRLSADSLREKVVTAVMRVRTEFGKDGTNLKDYSATLVGCVYDRTLGGSFFHIGDGAAVAAVIPEWRGIAVSKPENGEFCNETFFYTGDEWQAHLRLTDIPPNADVLALMSDGPMPFVMAVAQDGLEPTFAEPVVKHLLACDSENGSADLCATIDSDSARAISSDDKTLVMILWQAVEEGREH